MTSPPSARQSLSTRIIVKSQFDLAAELVGLEEYMRRLLVGPFRSLAVEVPARMDDGHIEVFRGYRVQHNG